MIEVDGFHRKGEYAVLTNGEFLLVTQWVGKYQEDCGPFDNPVAAVAGPDARGKWWSIDLSQYEPVVTQ